MAQGRAITDKKENLPHGTPTAGSNWNNSIRDGKEMLIYKRE
jgi:hypothetical protein